MPVMDVFWSGRMLRGEPATSRDLVRRRRASPMRFGDTLVSSEPLGRDGGGSTLDAGAKKVRGGGVCTVEVYRLLDCSRSTIQ